MTIHYQITNNTELGSKLLNYVYISVLGMWMNVVNWIIFVIIVVDPLCSPPIFHISLLE